MAAEPTDLRIVKAATAEDLEEAVRLSRAIRDWEYDNFPQHRPVIDAYYRPPTWDAFHRSLPETFSAPRGGGFLARAHGGRAVGLCLYSVAGDRLELHRLFVDSAGRGRGLGRKLVQACLDDGERMGATRAVLRTARFLTHAIGMYEAMGFTPTAPFGRVPDIVSRIVLHMERPIGRPSPGRSG